MAFGVFWHNWTSGFPRKLFEVEYDGTRIIVFKRGAKIDLWQGKLRGIIEELVKNRIFRKFSEVSIFFDLDKKYDYDLTSAIKSSKGNSYGHVLDAEVTQGLNRIYINESVIFKIETNTLAHDPVLDRMIRHLKETIYHEATHLWYLRENKIKRMKGEHESRLAHAIERLGNNSPRNWLELRSILMRFEMMVVYEGFATFCGELNSGKMDYSKNSFEIGYREAFVAARRARVAFDDYIDSYEKYMNDGFKEEDFEVFKKKLLGSVQSLDSYCYYIGCHMFHLITARGYMNVENAATLNFRQLLKHYEIAAKRIRLKKPVLGYSSSSVFDYHETYHLIRGLRRPEKGWKKQ